MEGCKDDEGIVLAEPVFAAPPVVDFEGMVVDPGEKGTGKLSGAQIIQVSLA
jgi:hypothetical protein